MTGGGEGMFSSLARGEGGAGNVVGIEGEDMTLLVIFKQGGSEGLFTVMPKRKHNLLDGSKKTQSSHFLLEVRLELILPTSLISALLSSLS